MSLLIAMPYFTAVMPTRCHVINAGYAERI